MGNTQPFNTTFETTVTKFQKCTDSDDYHIECDPSPNTGFIFRYIILEKSSPNFIDIYNKIKRNEAYKFILQCRYTHRRGSFGMSIYTPFYYIDDICECDTHIIEGTINGFIDLMKERQEFNYEEAIIKNNDTKRRLIIKTYDRQSMNIGKTYAIHHVKFYSSNFYLITKFEPIE